MSELSQLHQTFCDHAELFKGNTPRTIAWFRETFRYFVNDTQATSIHQITRELVEAYIIQGRKHKDWKPRTIRGRLSALKSFLDWTVDRGYLDKNPVADIPLPKLGKRLPKHLTQEEAYDLLNWTASIRYTFAQEKARAVAIISVFVFAGLRAQELLDLNLTDIRFNDRSLWVKEGKGQKGRLVPMTQDLIRALQAYIKERDRLGRNHPRLFLSTQSDGPLVYKDIFRLVKKLREASGIQFTPHVLRHTFATLMLEGGADIYAISRMMGHSDIKTTTGYLWATSGHLQSEIHKHPLQFGG